MGIKYKSNEKFFEKWSSDMAYVLGYMYADGYLNDSPYMRGKYVSISSIDEDSILRIKEWLGSEHTIKETRSHFAGSKLCYTLRIGSHKIYNDLYKLGLYPNKSLTVNFPKVPKKYFGHFIRGYFDGDGCVNLERKRNKKGEFLIRRIRIIFTSGSKIYSSKRSYQSRYNNKDSVLMFKLMYEDAGINSFFMRKFNIFKAYFELRPMHIDQNIKTILNFHIGHVVK